MFATLVAAAAISQTPKIPPEFKKWPIVYVSYDANTDRPNIFTANGDGTSAKKIANDGLNPVWSPDRKQIAFVRMRGIWVMNANGGDQKNVYSANGPDNQIVGLSWGKTPSKPASESLMFGLYGQNQTDVYRIERSGRDFAPAKLESIGLDWFGVTERAYPSVSTTGKTLAYTANGDIWFSLYDEDRWRTGRVVAVAKYDLSPQGGSNATTVARRISWVPGSRKLVFEYSRMWGSGVEDLWLLDFTSARNPILDTEKVKISRIGSKLIEPCVSPDGKWVLATRLYAYEGLIAISIDGKKVVRLVEKGAQGSW